MQALCWNARVACNNGTMDYFCSIVSTNRISLCGILESKAGPEKIANFCSNMGFAHFLHGNPINQKTSQAIRDSAAIFRWLKPTYTAIIFMIRASSTTTDHAAQTLRWSLHVNNFVKSIDKSHVYS
ncbi:unnamed protein product [Rhodiola kirilowii]